ncbi:GNAT family N-acetyltransferase [Roseiterribacter gracilis]|uniref:N-acetyltransferase domain-containing protein n=1 Tax=Roseiterribacter gracilis TaxID=2812848 RepID=A0A8S8XAI0_9PROT|nr:hypothetical protein TMPK1_04770 [Rhodospirillales bacterium TMPK1]
MIRAAVESDAEAAALVLRRSITELCARDHNGDPERIERWLANKTPDQLRDWIKSATNAAFVATRDDSLVGFGLIRDDGHILLNYVAPDARFTGVSKQLLAAMEDWARSHGLTRCTLQSTATAARFYRARGYRVGNDDALRKSL